MKNPYPQLNAIARLAFYTLVLQCFLINNLTAQDLSAQRGRIEKTQISVDFNNSSLNEIFSTIESQTNFYFAYEKALLSGTYEITLSSPNISLAEVLQFITNNTDLQFKTINKTIHVIKKNKVSEILSEQSNTTNPPLTVSGVVKDENGQGLPGLNVVLKGTTTGTVTDIEGAYSLALPDGDGILVFSYIGYIAEEVPVKNRSVIDIKMMPDIVTLNETVVIGYGTQRKRDLTGAVGSVDQERLADIPATNLAGALQGAVAGVSISTPVGAPGAGSSILIRGLNSINASNDPLIVVDGIPGGSINDIHPSDIASIDVLKDAASTSIYGSRATNGVIIITTKSGKSGKMSVTYDGYLAYSTPLRKVDVLDKDQYIAKQREIYRMRNGLTLEGANDATIEEILRPGNELDMYNLGKTYNWQEEILQPAPQHSHNLSLSGGSEKTKYFMAASVLDQTGIVQSSAFQRFSIRGNISSEVNKWLTIGTNLFVTKANQDIVPNGVFASAFQISPLGKKYLDEENPGKYTIYPVNPDVFITNPFTDMTLQDFNKRTKLLNGTYLEIKFLKDFRFKTTLNSILDYERSNFFAPFYTKVVEAFAKYEYAELRDWNRQYFNFENMLTYNKIIGNHDIKVTAVFSTEDSQEEYLSGYAKNFGSDYYGWTALHLGQPDLSLVASSEEKWFLESMIGRLNYSFKGKYLAQITVRRDRSSKFSKDNREAIFPGASIGWRISDEGFMGNTKAILSDLKLRASYAITGNQNINYRSRYNEGTKVRYTINGGQIYEGYDQTRLGNDDLKWEQSEQFNAGLDFAFLNGRISGSVEAYRTNTKDLLMTRSIQAINGYNNILDNIGKVRNEGLEISLSGKIIETPKFKMSANANFSKNRNQILDLYGDRVDDIANRWFIGKPLGVVYDYVFDGILQEGEEAPAHMDNLVGTEGDGKNIVPGEVKVKDIGSYQTLENGASVPTNVPDGRIDEADMQIIGYTQPKWFGSMGMQFKFFNFDASFYINHVNGTLRQVPVDLYDRGHMLDLPYYTDENPSTQYGRPAWANKIDGISRATRFANLPYFQSGTYTRLQDVTIGYTFNNLSIIGVKSFRLYATGQNLLTLTDFIGYDPSLAYERNQTRGEVSRIDRYPTTRNWIFGVKVSF